MKKLLKISFFLFFICFFLYPAQIYADEAQIIAKNKKLLKEGFANPPSIAPIYSDLSLFNSVVTDNESKGFSTGRRYAASIRAKLKKTYKITEEISASFNNTGNDTLTTEIIDPLDPQKKPVSATVEYNSSGGVTTVSIQPQKQVKPGKYTMVVSGVNGKVLQQDFLWGVLAINTNKSMYLPNEKAEIALGILDEQGKMVCDANVTLVIENKAQEISETLSTDNKKIIRTEQCYSHDYSLTPDYETSYTVQGEGVYTMTLTAKTVKGEYTIVDEFIVRKDIPFEIERISATRIYPPNTYPVIFKIKANEDFTGIVRESVPETFATSPITVSTRDLSTNNITHTVTAEPVEASESAHANTNNEALEKAHEAAESESFMKTPASISAAKLLGGKFLTGLPFTKERLTISIRMPFNGEYPLTQEFGVLETDPLLLEKYRNFGLQGHDGVDFGLPIGTPVLAADIGTVIFAGPGDYGNTVVVQHGWGRSYYGHLSEVYARVGSSVNQGDEVGLSGNTGLSTGPHLHFGIKPNDYDDHNGYYGKVDPLLYINNDVVKSAASGKEQIPDNLLKVSSIEYPLTLKKGQTVQIEYKYQAPPKSPEMYLLGPAQLISADDKLVFEEVRQWMIASDATWYNSSWEYRKLISFNNALISGTSSNFPTLISITSDSNIAANARSDGFDIIFTDTTSTTKYAAERMSYNSGTGALLYWVKIPSMTSGAQTYIYYGNSGSCDQTISACDGAAYKGLVWTDYRAVWHMESNPTTAQADSTTNALDLSFSGSGWTTANRVAGVVGSGLSFPGTANNILQRADNALLDVNNDFSYTAYLKITGVESNFQMYFKHVCSGGTCGSQDYSYRMWANDAGGDTGRQNVSLSLAGTDRYTLSTNSATNSNAILRTNTFGLVHTQRVGTLMRYYLNGLGPHGDSANVTASTMNNANGWLCLGSDCNLSQGSGGLFQGVMDEVRLSSTSQSTGWITTEWNNMNNPTGFISSLGAQECKLPPSNDKLMRHGKYFDACGRHGFTW